MREQETNVSDSLIKGRKGEGMKEEGGGEGHIPLLEYPSPKNCPQ